MLRQNQWFRIYIDVPVFRTVIRVVSALICKLPRERGTCLNEIRRYFYNASIQACQRFIYSGCKGNLNNFRNWEDCQGRCGGVGGKRIRIPPKRPEKRKWLAVVDRIWFEVWLHSNANKGSDQKDWTLITIIIINVCSAMRRSTPLKYWLMAVRGGSEGLQFINVSAVNAFPPSIAR